MGKWLYKIRFLKRMLRRKSSRRNQKNFEQHIRIRKPRRNPLHHGTLRRRKDLSPWLPLQQNQVRTLPIHVPQRPKMERKRVQKSSQILPTIPPTLRSPNRPRNPWICCQFLYQIKKIKRRKSGQCYWIIRTWRAKRY